MRRVFAAVLVAATTLIGGGAVSPLSAAATALPVGRLETNPARAELIQYGRRDDDGWGRRRGRDGGWDHRRDRYDDDDYDRPRRWYPRRHYGGGYGIHPRRMCHWRERRVWTHYGWRWRPVRVCRVIYW
jgi:hypothetical protein